LVARFQRVHRAEIDLDLGSLSSLPKQTESIVYRLLQECINNVAKHSQATNVNISVHSADGILQVRVEDDGVGFHPQEVHAKRDSFGLAGLRERVALLGGLCRVESQPPVPNSTQSKRRPATGEWHGTRIHIELPVSEEATRAIA